MIEDLVTWLRAQLDEDERRAPLAADIMRLRPGTKVFGDQLLADIQSKRQILDLHSPVRDGNEWIDPDTLVPRFVCSTCHDVPPDRDYDHCCGDTPFPCPTVRLLAVPYSDRPGYRQEWTP